ncbi:outer membrane beta-barrel protein [Marivirga sp.]|uniref:outer membrane beta-barrel protein n=1 Tax=Marivirga sp. TaxID=2018662 RepID=UPI0025FC5772|nr:outer membrane beta-barrel protein [Marivirga sp.]
MHHFPKHSLFLKFIFSFFLLLFTFISAVKAQLEEPIFPWNVELRAGVALPTGDLAETVNIGTDIGARIGYSLRERLMIRGGVETELYSGGAGFSDTQLWHYSGGVEYMFTDRGITEWRLSGHAGLGASTRTLDNATELRETYLSLNYGLKFGKGITDNTDWFVSLMGRTIFANPNDNTSFSTFNTIPITLGLNHRFNLSDKSLLDKMEHLPN